MKLFLFMLLSFAAITAIFSGILLMIDPNGGILDLPLRLLETTPFNSFKMPGILLAVLVGGINLAALFLSILRHPKRYNWAMAGGLVLCSWIMTQLIWLHAAHWLHFIFLGIGLLIILMAYQLKGGWIV